MWQRITRLRADAIVITLDGWIIVEVRPHAGPAALGALFTYLATWQAHPPTKDPVTALLITDQVTKDLRLAADNLGIPIEIV
jgi:hypothetical protein